MLLQRFEEKFPVIVNSLKNARKANRMAHAYLVHGDNHVLREEFATLIAQIALCPHAGDDGAPCGTCDVCDKLKRGVYPELHMLRPSGKMRFIKVGDRINPDPNTLRWFEDIFYKTTTSQYSRKVGVMVDCDRMNTEAQNAFLKTLEEPPPESSFILTTGNPASLLPTTRSRCQILMILENRTEFGFDGAEALVAALDKLTFKARKNLVVAEQCTGEILEVAKTLKAQANDKAEEEWADQLEVSKELETPVRKRIEDQFQAAAAAEYLRIRGFFLGAIHTWFAQICQLSCGGDKAHLANPEFLQGVEIPEQVDEEFAFKALRFAEDLIFSLRFNVDEELAIRTFCLNVALKS